MRIFLPSPTLKPQWLKHSFPIFSSDVVTTLIVFFLLTCTPDAVLAQKPSNTGQPAATPSDTAAINLVNINAASRAVLSQRLKGIGPAKAEAIVSYREKHGAFSTVEDLLNVKGIGPKTLEKLRPQLIAGEFKSPEAGESLAEREAAARAALQAIVRRSRNISEGVSVQ